MKNRFFALITFLLMGVGVVFAQQTITVAGTVLSSDNNEAVIGASVLIVGTSKGTITDIEGKFVLDNVPQGAQLKISFVGMIPQVVRAVENLKVSLKADAQLIDEVVVTALGIQRQAKAIGYATAKVDAEQLTMAKGSDATAALSGKVSGLSINITSPRLDQTTRITLRGARSFKGDNQALLVLDGVPTPTNVLQAMNPNDIDNISVLKGASAAALYGSDAANGVLIVTTKSGTKGKPSITYSLTTTFDNAAYFPKYQTRFGAGQPDVLSGLPLWSGYVSDENQQYGPEFNGEMVNVGNPINDGTEDGYYRQLPYTYIKNGRKNFYQTGASIQNDISYSSADDRGSMYLSYQRLDQTGTTIHDERTRQTVRFNASRNYKNLKVSARLSYINTSFDLTNDTQNGIQDLLNVSGNIDMADYKDWNTTEIGTGASPNEWVNSYYKNPWHSVDLYRRSARQDRITGSADFEYQATKWLRFMGRAGINVNNTHGNTKANAYHYTDWAKKYYVYASSDEIGSFSTYSTLSSTLNLDFMAFGEHKFNDDFAMKAMVGYSLNEYYYETKTVSAGSLIVDDVFNVANRAGELGGSNSWTRTRKLGVYGSLDLSFRDWAFLQITGRNDWTSLLDPSHWSFFYPGANLSVVLTDAIPAIKSDIMNHLKLRASAAKVGTVNVGAYNLENIVNKADYFPYGTLTAFSLSPNLRTRDIKPEFTTEYEVGAEFGFLNNRITLEAAAYTQTTTDQTTNVSIPYSTGFSSRYINAGTMRGKGLEFDLHLTPLLRFGDFYWNVSGNLTLIDTRVVALAGDEKELSLGDGGYAIVGEKYPMIKGSDWKRSPDGKVIVDAETGLPTTGEQIGLGTSDATIRIGLNSTMKWKGFSLGATFDYRGGHSTYFGIEDDMLFTGTSYASGLMGRQRFVFPNSVIEVTDAAGNVSYQENTNITVNTGGKNFWATTYKAISSPITVSGASWRLRELSLGYEFPDILLRKVKFIRRASLSVVGRNLFMWTPSTNVWGDPDYTTASSSNVSGISGTRAAGSRSYGFNLLISF